MKKILSKLIKLIFGKLRKEKQPSVMVEISLTINNINKD